MTSVELLDVNEGFGLHQRLLSLKQDIGLRFLEVGAILYRMKKEELYKVINPDMSWEAYCSIPEVSISPSHARNLMRIHRVFVLQLNVPLQELADIDQRKLTAILPSVTESNVELLLSDAKGLARADLNRRLHEDVDHEHKWEVIHFERCKICYEERNRSRGLIE